VRCALLMDVIDRPWPQSQHHGERLVCTHRMTLPQSHRDAAQCVLAHLHLMHSVLEFSTSHGLAMAAPTSRVFAQVVKRPTLWRHLVLIGVSPKTVKRLIRRAGDGLESVSLSDVDMLSWDPLAPLGCQPRLAALNLRHCRLRLLHSGFRSFCERRSRSRAAGLPFALRSWLSRTSCFWDYHWERTVGMAFCIGGMPISVQDLTPGVCSFSGATTTGGCGLIRRCVEPGCRVVSCGHLTMCTGCPVFRCPDHDSRQSRSRSNPLHPCSGSHGIFCYQCGPLYQTYDGKLKTFCARCQWQGLITRDCVPMFLV